MLRIQLINGHYHHLCQVVLQQIVLLLLSMVRVRVMFRLLLPMQVVVQVPQVEHLCKSNLLRMLHLHQQLQMQLIQWVIQPFLQIRVV